MTAQAPEDRAERILIVAPVGRDAVLMARALALNGFEAERCADLHDLHRQIELGAGAVLLTSEALVPATLPGLLAVLHRQPVWSDLQIVVLTSGISASAPEHRAIATLEEGANVTILGRPVHAQTLVNTAKVALRARRRQYDARSLLAREQAARTEVEAASRAKDEFLATLSHELRTPLNAMLGWVQMLRAGTVPAEKRGHALEVIERNARAQTQLIEDLLESSRIIRGNVQLQVGPVDVKHVVELALDVVRPAASAKGVRLEAALDPDAGPLMADAARLQQIIWNLLTNAVKFTPRSGRVHVDLRRAEPFVELAVTDNGQGIHADFLPHVFERFRQADSSITRVHGGLGLGLAIVRHLVELHGGTIKARSEGEGKGATFTVKIPLAPRGSAAIERRLDRPDPPAHGGKVASVDFPARDHEAQDPRG